MSIADRRRENYLVVQLSTKNTYIFKDYDMKIKSIFIHPLYMITTLFIQKRFYRETIAATNVFHTRALVCNSNK